MAYTIDRHPGPDAPRLGAMVLHPIAESVPRARRWFQKFIAPYNPACSVDDCALMISELVTNAIVLRARRAGLRVIPLRNTRHTCSSLLVALKVRPKVAQRILRHSQIAMTMEVYAEASEEEVRAALGKLSAAMGGSDTGGADG